MPQNPFDLSGRTALVTGSSRGIGRAIAEGLARAGARVVLNGRDDIAVEATRLDLAEHFGSDRIYGCAFDVTDSAAVDAAIPDIESQFGPIDILVNNAGIQHRVPLLDLAVDDWSRVLATNTTAVFLVGRAVARGMTARGAGRIVNIGSVQSDLARPGIGAYTASKGAVRNLTRAMAAEWASKGLSVNAIAPGYLRTEMTKALVENPEFSAWVEGRTPAGRWGELDDVVGPVLFLCSDAAAFVNGQTLFVDGGMTVVI
jgi:gluconate 5-dehydrogenase